MPWFARMAGYVLRNTFRFQGFIRSLPWVFTAGALFGWWAASGFPHADIPREPVPPAPPVDPLLPDRMMMLGVGLTVIALAITAVILAGRIERRRT